MVRGFQKIFKRPQNALVVVDHRNDMAGWMVGHRVLPDVEIWSAEF